MWRQVLAVTSLSLSSIRARAAASTIVVIGIAGVVAVLLGLLAMSAGFRKALADTAQPDRALVVRNGSNNEMGGWLTTEELALLEQIEGLELLSGEVYVTMTARKKADGSKADVVGRGVTAAAFRLRPEVRIVNGRAFEAGKAEAIVGVAASAQYEGLDVGDTLEARGMSFTVVGHFASDGAAVESEVWMDLPIAQTVFRRAGVVSVGRIRIAQEASVASINEHITKDPRITATAIAETEFFAAQSASRAALIDVFAYFIATIMALGAIAAALNTMYTAVSQRSVEIATLRAIGFGSGGVVVSVVIEAMLLATLGGVIGAVLVYAALDGYATSTLNAASGSQLAFAFRLTPALASTGLAWALTLGLLGGLLPALRAARMPITRGLRGD